ncbi:2-dehydropantoate 2-reductase [Salipiger sp. P9]|uniref:ketopantoate reductase family protein n=1 Tax=Salipiger pentaromativorans TaxID=2943193 RepID=UPI0021583B6F|nr:2-dehydropantoate 2-reductase [Salipiger pentaromativorans]
MKVCVYGAGAIGGHLAVKLSQAGCDVSVVARGAHLAAIRENGLTLVSSAGSVTCHPVAVEDPAELPVQDLVVATVKTPALAGIAEGLRGLSGPGTAIAYCVNGLPWWYLSRVGGGIETWSPAIRRMIERLETAVGTERAIGGIAFSANHVDAPGVIRNSNPDSGHYLFGEAHPAGRDACDALVAALRQGSCAAERSERFEREIWKKLSLNCVSGPIGALTGMETGRLLTYPDLEGLTRAAWTEVGRLAESCGQPGAMVSLSEMAQKAGRHKSSMLQDFEAGRTPEIETLLGALSDLARARQMAIPALDALLALTRARATALGLLPATPAPAPAGRLAGE